MIAGDPLVRSPSSDTAQALHAHSAQEEEGSKHSPNSYAGAVDGVKGKGIGSVIEAAQSAPPLGDSSPASRSLSKGNDSSSLTVCRNPLRVCCMLLHVRAVLNSSTGGLSF